MADSNSSSATPLTRLKILGVPCDLVSPTDARGILRTFLSDPWDGRTRQIVTLNPEYVMTAQRTPAFALALATSELITADGIGVQLANRLLGGRSGQQSGRVTGVDLLEWLIAESGLLSAPVFFLGGRPGVAERAALTLKERLPGCLAAGWWSNGTASADDDAETIARIQASGAKAVAVAYGAPGQVVWIERNRGTLANSGVRVAIGVGGAFDFISGDTPRAPVLFRRLGIEWLYRLVKEPWRWRRQRVLPVFALRVVWQWFRTRRR